MSYTVGQIVYTTDTASNGSVAKGVQQPFEISVVTGIDETEINLFVSAYPNPTNDYIILKFNNFQPETFSFQLYDMNGKLIEYKRISGIETSIVMNKLANAAYFLKVISNNKEVKTFKIIKN